MEESTIFSKISDCYKGYPDKEYPDSLALYKMLESPNGLRYGKPLLFYAAENADVEAVKYLLEAGADPTVQDSSMENTALHAMAYNRSDRVGITTEDVKQVAILLLDAGTSALKKNVDNRTCAYIAAENGYPGLIAALVERQKKLDLLCCDGETPLHAACSNARNAASSFLNYSKKQHEALLEKPCADYERRVRDEQLKTSKRQYDRDKQRMDNFFETIRLLVDAGLDPEQQNNYGRTPKEAAFDCEDLRVAAVLNGTYVPPEESDGDAELTMRTKGMIAAQAVMRKDADALEAILQLGEDPNVLCDDIESVGGLSPQGLYPLGIACMLANEPCIRLLCAHGADPNLKDSKGNSPAAYLFYAGATEKTVAASIMECLLGCGLDVNASIDDNGASLLLRACDYLRSGHNRVAEELLRILLRNGADLNLADHTGATPLMKICAGSGTHIENAQVSLLEQGADIALQDKNGNTALMYAANNSNNAMAKTLSELLFEFGDPKVGAVNNDGKAALDFAVERDNQLLVNYLLTKE